MKYSKQNMWKIGRAMVLGLLLATPAIAMPWDRGDDRGWGDRRSERSPHLMHHKGGFGMDPGMHLIQMGRKLDLTDEQESQILKLSQNFRAEIKANREKGEATRAKMTELRNSETFDEDAIRSTMQEAYPVMIDGMVLRAKYKSDLSKVLTDEQREEIKDLRKKMKKRFKYIREKRMGDGTPYRGDCRVSKPDVE